MQEIKNSNDIGQATAVTFIRITTKDAINGGGDLKNHRAAFSADAKDNDIYIVIGFADIRRIENDKRPELARLFYFLKNNQIDFVYIPSLSHLSDNIETAKALAQMIEETGSQIIFTDNKHISSPRFKRL
jgi:DNA invertase Pin-like site-specific DNA recombinase